MLESSHVAPARYLAPARWCPARPLRVARRRRHGQRRGGVDGVCRAWCDAEASCFAIQWVPGEGWCNPCTGWANDQGVDSLGAWAATSGDAEVQSKECWQSGHDDGDEDDCTPGWHSMNCLDGTVMYGEGCTSRRRLRDVRRHGGHGRDHASRSSVAGMVRTRFVLGRATRTATGRDHGDLLLRGRRASGSSRAGTTTAAPPRRT